MQSFLTARATAGLAALGTLALLAQTPNLPKEFDVASIKPNTTSDNRIMIGMPGGGQYTATGVTARLLIQQAYNVRDFQISGGPGWISTDRWDINAKAEGIPDRLPPNALAPLLQALLSDRFQLKVHRETKEMPIYALVVAKGGSKLQANTDGQGPMIRMGRGDLQFKKVGMAMLATQLSQQTGRIVLDKTGIAGDFDLTLKWTPDVGQGGSPFGGPGLPPGGAPPPPPDPSAPSLFTALPEQLGLRLESARGPVEVLVIDGIEKPSEN